MTESNYQKSQEKKKNRAKLNPSKKGIIFSVSLVIVLVVATFLIGIFLLVPTYEAEEAFPNLEFEYPVGIYHAGDDSDRLFVVEQGGTIKVFENEKDTKKAEIFLDISQNVTFGGEMGLLGLAFHPEYRENGIFFLDYITDNPTRTIVSKFQVDPNDPNRANESSEEIILEIEQPYQNHNGGQIAFGLDGYLYIALGDGGSAGDPDGNGQDKTTLLGSILRIDVDISSPYGIPEDNPFKDNSKGYKEEIYAYGLRNPWRFSFDSKTENLWAADVGQNKYEEINLIEKGKNYGWNIKEGFHCYDSEECDGEGLEEPIYEYPHSVGQSITGGFVYRGERLEHLFGEYIYGDYEYGQIWALSYKEGDTPNNKLLVQTDIDITSFGTDETGELYFCGISGKIYQLTQTNPLFV